MDVKSYEFTTFEKAKVKASETSEFQFKSLFADDPHLSESHQKIIKGERESARGANFTISPIVRQHRGMNDQEVREHEMRVQDEVERRLAKIEEQAFEKGYQEGMKKGMEEIFSQTRVETESKIEYLTEMINEVLAYKAELLDAEKKEVYRMVRNLTKWVILRELKDDGQYIERLLEKLILELQTKNNLLIQVNKHHFEQMPEVLEHVEKKLGQLKNVRVEVDFDVKRQGLIVESENGIINGDLSQQFTNLDKLFGSLGLHEIEEFPELQAAPPVAEESADKNEDEGENGES
ncbi:MAG: hypothetical protein COW00_17280 [Bdellovibrio sp. CG12_big_fil_rev_8_21_14_0_65_39_13]|nr:MAG: hypothetical protein COW78_00450 [Bdellovibrio sp. CG22_combo_CG10-13_8_21_14_all_39_27]PIQ58188.1 MAG: hypothetical protein COW00_17280 [Bdellovibrio sp. CG12_big_fil_rev_8_21_14_0_65_39_13]PIR34350.1 MAG: hypothetical protein COV37_13520 [Bdellovibrio sp. CG11_big_fil_rev_8_21_14_0_20_39_38]PJB54423.1 MAG: hypothetical protein CO099_01680 [Bdellovibrio sp. CG_4_9_14_3_um_filter_39_7]